METVEQLVLAQVHVQNSQSTVPTISVATAAAGTCLQCPVTALRSVLYSNTIRMEAPAQDLAWLHLSTVLQMVNMFLLHVKIIAQSLEEMVLP